MTEREIEDLLWDYPEKLLNEPLKQYQRQPQSSVGRADLIFTDRLGRLLVVEIKRGKLARGAINQLVDYFGMMKEKFPDKPVELMVVANSIPQERRRACEQYNIDWQEISEKKFRDVAEEVGYVFQSEKENPKDATRSPLEAASTSHPSEQNYKGKPERWTFSQSLNSESNVPEFLGRCTERGKTFFSSFFQAVNTLKGKVKIIWKHESGFSLHFYFHRLGFVEMVWGFPAFNRKGASRVELLRFPFDFSTKREVPSKFIDDFGSALSASVPFSGQGLKRPSYEVTALSTTDVDHILKTICDFANKASSVG